MTEECLACELLNCFYNYLKLNDKERRLVERLHDNPKKAVEYLKRIRSSSELKKAMKKCSSMRR